MSDQKPKPAETVEDPAKVARDAAKAAAAEQKEQGESSEGAEAFPVERLISEGKDLLGHDGFIVAGALHGISKKNLTLDEAKAAVDAWLAAPVAQEG